MPVRSALDTGSLSIPPASPAITAALAANLLAILAAIAAYRRHHQRRNTETKPTPADAASLTCCIARPL